MLEEWRIIQNAKLYAVSNFGRVKRLERKEWNENNKCYSIYKEKILTPSTNNTKGYKRLDIIWSDGTKTRQSVHRLVAIVFIPNPLNLPQINHKDGDKLNNYDWNLEWCTNTENQLHSYRVLGNIGPRGEQAGANILKESEVKQIPELLLTMKSNEISILFKVKPSTITEIIAGRSWQHLNLKFPNKTERFKKGTLFSGVYIDNRNNKYYYKYKNINTGKFQCKGNFTTAEEAYNELVRLRDSPNLTEM